MRRALRWVVGSVLSVVCAACAAEGEEPSSVEEALRGRSSFLDVRRSLAVTDAEILARFPLSRVMDRLAREANVKGLTGISLFQQWWDTQNEGPGLGRGAHCDDYEGANGQPILNGYPYDCRPAPSEGAQAACSSFDAPACRYIPIGLFNRFDKAPPDGEHCGEYRIIYAKESGQTARLDRNLFILEATLPNPRPWQGLQGCREIVEGWAELSLIDDLQDRALLLETMYFSGIGRTAPIVRFDHFGNNPAGLGQIRTNQFINPNAPFVWTLREFKLVRSCPRRGGCRAELQMVTAKANPTGVLFGDAANDPRAADFQAQFARDAVEPLLVRSLFDIFMDTPDRFNSGQSHSSGSMEMDLEGPFTAKKTNFRTQLWRALGACGSKITPEQLVRRAATQTCAGCHQLSNGDDLGEGLVWPASLGFVHVSEENPETVDGHLRFRISPALTSTFLPERARVMVDYLNTRPSRRRGRGVTLGGRFTH